MIVVNADAVGASRERGLVMLLWVQSEREGVGDDFPSILTCTFKNL